MYWTPVYGESSTPVRRYDIPVKKQDTSTVRSLVMAVSFVHCALWTVYRKEYRLICVNLISIAAYVYGYEDTSTGMHTW